MFLPNSHSFLLVRSVLLSSSSSDPGRKLFLPNTDSFLLRHGPIVDPIYFAPEGFTPTPVLEETGVGEQSKIKDQGKRTFLKVASIAGASAIASQILSPKKASAFIMGSSPTTGVVGVKDSTNVRINPATEETLDEVLKTSDLTFDAGGNLQVQITS